MEVTGEGDLARPPPTVDPENVTFLSLVLLLDEAGEAPTPRRVPPPTEGEGELALEEEGVPLRDPITIKE